MNNLGKLFSISHQSKETFLMENIHINNTLSDGIHIHAADKQRTDVQLKVKIHNMTATKTINSFSSLISVSENSKLQILESKFEENFGLAKGSVVCGDHKNVQIEIFNT